MGYSVGTLEVLKKISLELPDGKRCILLGPNGAGKSTLMRVASGYAKPTSGEVQVNNKPLFSFSLMERAKKIAVLTQRSSLDFPFTAEEVVTMGRTPYGKLAGNHVAALIITALHINGERVYTRLSGGEKQLVQLARVFSQVWERGNEAFLLLDEPMAALDLNHQKEVVALLRKFSSEGTGQMIVMHDVNLAAEIADIIVLMSKGEVISVGPVAEVLTAEALENTYGVPMAVLQDGEQRFYKTVLHE